MNRLLRVEWDAIAGIVAAMVALIMHFLHILEINVLLMIFVVLMVLLFIRDLRREHFTERIDTSLGRRACKALLAGMLAEVGLQLAIVYSSIGQTLFGTAALPLNAWLVALPFALCSGPTKDVRPLQAVRDRPEVMARGV